MLMYVTYMALVSSRLYVSVYMTDRVKMKMATKEISSRMMAEDKPGNE